jgi:hypothetical protein
MTLIETPWLRLELGFGYEYLNLGDLPTQIKAQGGPTIDDNLALYNANARLQLVKDGGADQKWLPAITAGIHYKYNDGMIDINNKMHGVLNDRPRRPRCGIQADAEQFHSDPRPYRHAR